MSGTLTANEFIYKPDLGSAGAIEKGLFDAGQDRVDTRLGKEIWVGDPLYGATLQTAITAIGSTQAILRLPAGTWGIAADLTIPANITIKPERGAILSVTTGKTLTINGTMEAGLYQIFSCAGTGKVTLPGWAEAEWFGVNAAQTAANNYTYFTRVAESLPNGGVLRLSTLGNYNADGLIPLTTNLKVVIEKGVIWNVVGTTGAFQGLGTKIATTTLSGNAAIGAVALTVTNSAGFVAGQKVWIYYTSIYPGRCDVSIVESVSAGTINLTLPLRYAWTSATGVTVDGVTPVENIIIKGGGKIQNINGASSDNLISFFWAWDCHVRDLTLAQRTGTSRCLLFSNSFGHGAAFCTAENIRVLEASETGVEVYPSGAAHNRLSNITVDKVGIGFGIKVGGSGNIVSNPIVKKSRYGGVGIQQSFDLILSNPQCSGSVDPAYQGCGVRILTTTLNGISIIGGSLKGNYFGIYGYDGAPAWDNINIIGTDLSGCTIPISMPAGITNLTMKGNTPTIERYLPEGATSGTGEDTLFSVTVKAYSMTPYSGFEFTVPLDISGANNTKTIKIYFGSSIALTVVYIAGDVGSFTLHGIFIANAALTGGIFAFWGRGASGVFFDYSNAFVVALSGDLDFKITCECANASDTVVSRLGIIKPIGPAL